MINNDLGWIYSALVNVFLVFCLVVMVMPAGKIRMGDPDSKPEYSFISWLTMMFSAGMGIGLIYWSVAEPLKHYAMPPLGEGFTPFAMTQSLNWTFMHWGLHTWAIYVMLGMALGLFSFRHHLPFTIRTSLWGLLPKPLVATAGNAIDVLAVLGTLFGVATSLGLGVMQLNAGLNRLLGVPDDIWVQIVLIVGITAVATMSVISGIGKGIKWLSNFNMFLGTALFLLVFLLGPAQWLINQFGVNVWHYLQHISTVGLQVGTFENMEWKSQWTNFYWGWWISWSPFVGLFMARISKGRTLREFILGAMLVPTVLTFTWIHVFGGAALYFESVQHIPLVQMMGDNISSSLFVLFAQLPFGFILSVLGMLALFTFFVTSSDSGSLVIDMITAGGDPNPPVVQKVFWAVLEGFVAIILLLMGGLNTLQTAAICMGFPFALMLLLVFINLIRYFFSDHAGEIQSAAKEVTTT